MSFLKGASVCYVREFCSVKQAFLDPSAGLGLGALLAKCGTESPFKPLPVHPYDFDQLRFRVEDEFYYNRSLVMRSSTLNSVLETLGPFINMQLEARDGGSTVVY